MLARLGLSGGLVPRDSEAITPALAKRLCRLGVRAVVLHLLPPPEKVADGIGYRVGAVLADEGIAVVQATAYNPNLIHPEPRFRREELTRLRRAFAAAESLGAEMVLTGCGSLHPDHFYGPHPGNHTDQARARLVESLAEAAPWAEEAGIVLALECHALTTLDRPDHIAEVLAAVGSPWVRANFDPVNLLGDLASVYQSGAAMRRMWHVVGPWYARSAHIKDVAPSPGLVVHIDEVPPGAGLLDMNACFEVVKRLGEGAAVIVEHLPEEQVEAALRFVAAAAERAGITLA